MFSFNDMDKTDKFGQVKKEVSSAAIVGRSILSRRRVELIVRLILITALSLFTCSHAVLQYLRHTREIHNNVFVFFLFLEWRRWVGGAGKRKLRERGGGVIFGDG